MCCPGGLRVRFGGVAAVAATFVSLTQLRVMVPHALAPQTVDVTASNNNDDDGDDNEGEAAAAASDDGRSYGGSAARYTFYDPFTKPRITGCSPAYGHYEYQTDVTIRGSNFAPTGAGLQARWGPLGVTEATFISSSAMKARAPSLKPQP